MPSFGIIAEGATDQSVIENILLGYFADQEDDPVINPVQPSRPSGENPAGWPQVFQSLKQKDYEGALQFNDFLVIHIDTDVQEELGFDVPRREGGKVLSDPDRINRVIARLKKDIDANYYQANADKIVFAIAVDSVECWLLPLLHLVDKKKAAKTTGCLDTANNVLRKANKKGLAAGDKKFVPAYEAASSDYRKRKTLLKLRGRNLSLEHFIKQLNSNPLVAAARQSAASQGNGDASPAPVRVDASRTSFQLRCEAR